MLKKVYILMVIILGLAYCSFEENHGKPEEGYTKNSNVSFYRQRCESIRIINNNNFTVKIKIVASKCRGEVTISLEIIESGKSVLINKRINEYTINYICALCFYIYDHNDKMLGFVRNIF